MESFQNFDTHAAGSEAPSGSQTWQWNESPRYLWENSRFLWQCSMAIFNYQRVDDVQIHPDPLKMWITASKVELCTTAF